MTSIHLLVLIHGMWGNPSHLSELDRIIRETHGTRADLDGTELHVLLAETNADDSTYDGIDWGGERVAQEVLDEANKLANAGKVVTKFSITGYSLGGLLARYVVGILRQRDFFTGIAPVNFNTMATPHIGLLKYPSMISTLFSSLGPKLLSRTGEQFYCVDTWSASGRPLLEVMADPDRVFYQALSAFQHIRIYANAINDITVPYLTAAIEAEDPFAAYKTNGLEIALDPKYTPLVKSHALPAVPPAPPSSPTFLTPAWFRALGPDRPLLPPFLQLRFPFNLVLYALLPLLIPLGIALALTRLALASRSSRARIRLLERDADGARLIHVLARLEQRVEHAVADIVDDPATVDRGGSEGASGAATPAEADAPPPAQKPILSPLQIKIAAALNRVPGLRKEFAFIENVRNAHAVIVSRDVKRFPGHRAGEGIIRHWADSFIL